MSEMEELKKRVAELEKAAKPPEPFVPMPMPRRDLTEGSPWIGPRCERWCRDSLRG